MKLLLDTCTFLWLTTTPDRLSEHARELFQEPTNACYLSAASVWEIAIKYGLKRLPLPAQPSRFVPEARQAHGVESLPIEEVATAHVAQLPALHRDPFDRLLVSQAIVHGLTLLTPDPVITRYPCLTTW